MILVTCIARSITWEVLVNLFANFLVKIRTFLLLIHGRNVRKIDILDHNAKAFLYFFLALNFDHKIRTYNVINNIICKYVFCIS